MMRKKLLWVGDAACPSGFARATHAILETVRRDYDVVVLGMNYRGDPHDYPYPIFAAAPGGDAIGYGRLLWMCNRVRPDVIVVQNDGWLIPHYFQQLRRKTSLGEYQYPEFAAIPVVAAVAVDGMNFRGDWIKDVSMAVFWTEFALNEARIGGYAGPSAIIPLGVDLETFYPVDRHGALERQKASALMDKFIVGNVNRNQSRKRLDLTIKYFAEWVHAYNVRDAELFLHTAPTGDDCANVLQLAQYYGVLDRLAFREPEIFYGNPDDDMRDTYSFMDVQITTTQGEGFGLTTFEGMACGTPQIVPDWSGLGELTKGAAAQVRCTSTALQSQNLSVIGGIADEKMFVQALDTLYRDKTHREMVAAAGLKRVTESRFRWEHIGEAWLELLANVLAGPEPLPRDDEIWREIKPQVVTT